MSIEGTVVAWNVKDGLADPKRAEQISRLIQAQQPLFVVISEAAPASSQLCPDVVEALGNAIGGVAVVEYGDADERKDTHCLVTAAHGSLGSPTEIRAGGRSALRYKSPDGTVFVGYHGLDRIRGGSSTDHTTARVHQAREILESIGDASALVAGDLNEMYSPDAIAQRIRYASILTRLLPYGEPGEPHSKLARLGSLGTRLGAMARGEALRLYEEAGFLDADPAHEPTMRMWRIGVQLDHIVYRGRLSVGNFAVVPVGELSDHSMITAHISTQA